MKVDLSLFERKLTIDSMYLTPIQESTTLETSSTYQVLAPRLILDLKSVSSIFLKKELSIEQIAVFNPQLRIVKGNGESINNITYEAGDLYQLISRYINVFEVGQLLIEKAGVNYINKYSSNNDFELQNLDFLVENFLMDSSKSSDRYFFTDRIKLVLTDQTYLLNDDNHQLHFDTLMVSTRQKKLEFKGLSIHPKDSNDHSVNLYNVNIPSFTLNKVDFDGIYLNNKVSIGECISQGGTVNIQINTVKTDSEIGVKKFQLPKLKQALLLENFNFNFTESNLIFGNDTLAFKSLELIGDSLALDSTSQIHDLNELLTNASLSLIETRFSNGKFTSSLDTITYQLAGKKLKISNLELKNSLADISIPLANILFSDARTDHLEIQCITLKEPIIYISEKSNSAQPTHIVIPEWLKVNCLNLIDANFKFSNIFSMSGIHASMTIDDRLFNDFKNFKQHIPKYKLNSQSWYFNKGNLTVKGNSFFLDHLGNFSTKSVEIDNESVALDIDQLLLKGFYLDSLINYKKIAFSTLKVIEPKGSLSFVNKPQASNQAYSFDTLDIINGQVAIDLPENNRINLDDINFKVSRNNEEYFMLVDIGNGKVFDVKKHDIEFENLLLNEQLQEFNIAKIDVRPKTAEDSQAIYATAKNLRLNEFDLKYISQPHNPITLGQVLLDSLNFYGFWNLTSGKTQEANLRKLAIAHFQINNLNANIQADSNKLHLINARLVADYFDSDKVNVIFDNKIKLFGEKINYNSKGLKAFLDSVSLESYEKSIRTKHGKLRVNNDSISFDGIDLTNIDIGASRDTFHIKNVSLESPVFKLDLSKRNKKQEGKMPLFIELDDVKMTNGTINILNTGIKYNNDVKIAQLSLNTQHLSFNTDLSHLKYNGIQLSTGALNYTTSDSLYSVTTDKFVFDDSGDIHFSNVVLRPVYNRRDFSYQIDHQKDWLSGSVKNIYINKWNIKRFLNDSAVYIRKIVLDNPYLETHRDKRLPEPVEIVKPLPQQYLKDLNRLLNIDTVSILNCYVSHSEYSPTGVRPGFIYFKNINGEITNITNVQDSISRDPLMNFNAKGTLYKTGNFLFQSSFHLNDSKNKFDVTARVGNMDLTEMNVLLEHTAHISIKSGVNRLNELNFQANDHYALGEMKFYYKDLKISVLKETADHVEENASFKSFFANVFIVHKKNPRFLFVKKGDIYFERNEEKSIFSYWAKSILSGVVTSIGAGNNKKEIKELKRKLK
ncbi:MAG: hypothetical protein RIC03_18530 [Cyclobacteriaceae bacterium]